MIWIVGQQFVNPKPAHQRVLLLWVAVLWCLISIGFVHAQAAADGALILVSPPTFAADQVSAQFLVRAAGLQRYDLLTAANVTVGEAADSIQLTPQSSAPMTMFVLVNLSYASDVDLIRQTLSAYFDTYYREGDKAIFFVQGTYQFETYEPADQAAIRALIAGLTASTAYTAVDNGMVSAALERVRSELAENPARTVQAMFVASYFISSDNPSFGRNFAALNVPLHVIQAHRFRESTTSQLRTLADNGGGVFVDNRDGRFIQAATPNAPISSLRLAYDAIESSRTVYTLSYHPLRKDLVVQPTVTLSVQLGANRQVSADFSYERTFAAPQIDLTGVSLNLHRTPSYQGSQIVFDNTAQRIRARILFPDSVPRRIDSLHVELINTATNQVLQSALDLQPEIDPLGYFNVDISLQDFSRPNTVTPVRVTLSVTDELSLTASANLDGGVNVAALPVLPTVAPSATAPPAPTATPVFVPTEIPLQQLLPATAAPTDPPLQNPVVLLFAGIILFLVIVIAIMFVRLQQIRRRQRTNTVTGSSSAVADMGIDTDAGQPLATAPPSSSDPPAAPAAADDGKLYGRLIVVKGLTEVEILITKTEFVIGRSETSACDYIIPAPFVSSRHCVITQHNGKFSIRDLKSKNGVFVNGERIPIDRDVIVPIGSEVGITQNIIVELWDPDTVVSAQRSRISSVAQSTQLQSRGLQTDYLFRAVPGIRYVDDEEEVDDDYSPL